MSNAIVKRIVYAIKVKLKAPLVVSSGENKNTDSDVLLDFDGSPFIPGSSIAGALRNYLELQNKKDDAKALFGFAEGDNGHMSPLIISDFFFDNQVKISVRDGVKLKNKIAIDKAKYDTEIIETGGTGTAYFQLIIRERNETKSGINISSNRAEKRWIFFLYQMLKAVHHGDIRFGAKKNRGFGRIEIISIKQKIFTKENVKEWLKFEKYSLVKNDNIKNLDLNLDNYKSPFVTITAPLRLQGGVSIRCYSAKSGAPDFEHITCNGVPVIPGNSWNGAIRSRALDFLKMLGIEHECAVKTMDYWFGSVFDNVKEYEKLNNRINQSNVIISESIIKQSKSLQMTRNRINRFDASTIQGALYTELAVFDGEGINLALKVRKTTVNYEALIGLLILVIKDIMHGYLPIGGQTAVGRGIFSGKEESIRINSGTERMQINDYMKAFDNYINGGTNDGH